MKNRFPSPIENERADFGVEEIRGSLRRLERRDQWSNAVMVILGLAAAAFSLSAYFAGKKTFFGSDYTMTIRILVTLVVVFTAQMVFQHLSFRKLLAELGEQQIQAEVFRRLALFDPLTGLYNRRFAEQRLKAEISRSHRRGHPLTVIFADLNQFKEINDTYGHQAGDTVLKEFAKRLNRVTRGADLAVRWGGDEFMMILVDCEPAQIPAILGRLQDFSVEVQGRELPISLAIGWKAYKSGDKVEDLIEGADRMLYLDKASARKQPDQETASMAENAFRSR